jgi:MFS family permease
MVQAGLGIAAAFAVPTWSALYAKYETKGKDGYDWGLVRGSADLMIAIAIIIGGILVTTYSFTTLFVVMGIVQVIATIYQAKILKN